MRKITKYLLISLLFLSAPFYSEAQEGTKNQTIEDLIEEIASNSDDELDYTTLYDDLNFFMSHPIDLNNTSQEELEKLQFLNDFQIHSVLKYKERFGSFVTIYELQLLVGFSMDDIVKLLPFVTVGDYKPDSHFKFKNAIKYGSNQVFIRSQQVLEQQKGFSPIDDSSLTKSPNSRYLGSPQKIYGRYKYQYKDKIYMGFTVEKDAGEAFLKNSINEIQLQQVENKAKNGFDYGTFHLQINGIGPVKTLALGDFQAQFGQGLTLWSGMSYGKSPYALNIKKKAQKVRRYSSTDENLFMRGAGTTLTFGDFEVTGFISKRKIDANIAEFDSLDSEERVATSLQSSGLHSTVNELLDKDAISITMFGGNASYAMKEIKLGATYVYYEYSNPVSKSINKYNQYDFSGQSNFNAGFDYQFVIKNINFFGEAATSKNGALAFVNGATMNLAPRLSLAVLHRSYDRDYQAPYANAFAESKVSNEKGLYLGTIFFPIKKWKFSAYYDAYSFPWLKSGTYAPSHGVDYLFQADFKPGRYVDMYFRFKNEIKQKNGDSEGPSPKDLTEYGLMKLRYHLSYSISRNLVLKNRIEYVLYNESDLAPEKGFMIYQDISYKLKRLPIDLSMRFAIFDASYNARIYAYETDVLYAFSIPAYSYKGTRTYLTAKYSVNDKIDFWFRISQFYYDNKNVISSGLTEIDGNKKTEVKVQLRIRF